MQEHHACCAGSREKVQLVESNGKDRLDGNLGAAMEAGWKIERGQGFVLGA
ncbi:hypothetical protein PVOR_14184 [Paenibacillus vortex V453]|uniref:Uncharacterized protein n=1 Tax=Paenibacillus vortex V453 TaxID=715225 RepID=A0A2R9SVX6_9BACL|nr:hypothetical protein [Paenibacillus vortex]EFU41510.1 hypothetical protein PVOR_14184 [Paenibacillus vortex V453]